MHPERRLHCNRHDHLAQTQQWEQLYRLIMLEEAPSQAQMGWQMAFLRPFCIPRMANVLAAGSMVQNPLKRTYDTGLMIYELVHQGIDSPTGRTMIGAINRAHRGHGIVDEDMTYVLCAFIVIPFRYLARTSWRPITDDDCRAATAFYRHVGQLMNIKHLPASYSEAARILDDYERRYLVPSPATRQMGNRLLKVLREELPRVVRPVAGPLFAALMDEPAVSSSLGVRAPPAPISKMIGGGLRAWARVARSRRLPPPVFSPGAPAPPVYPDGYSIEQLGVSAR